VETWVKHGPARWEKTRWRVGVIVMVFVTTVLTYLAIPATAHAACTDAEKRNHMTCSTDPAVSKCVLSIAAAGGIGGLFGGPLGFLAGVATASVNCAIQTIG
jgi:hypothetical protein